jgi:hypothetical protein
MNNSQQSMQTNSQNYNQPAQRERRQVRLLYRVLRTAFIVYAVYFALLLVVLLLAWIFNATAFGSAMLNGAVPWQVVLPVSLLLIIVFPIADTFIQAREEQWFAQYGTSITAKVKGVQEVRSLYPRLFPRWRWLQNWVLERRTQLEWTHPDTGKTYTYTLRVRDQIMPNWGTNLPVLIDYDDPTYYLKQDIKDQSLRF